MTATFHPLLQTPPPQDGDKALVPKRNVLFLPAAIRSHILPAFSLADVLTEEFAVHFAVTDAVLAESVRENGFTPVLNSRFRVGVGMEADWTQQQSGRVTWWGMLRTLWTEAVFRHRQNELARMIEQLNPALVIVDVFNSTDYLVLKTGWPNLPVVFFNPMLSVYRVANYPTVSEADWNRPRRPTQLDKSWDWQTFWRRPKTSLLQWVARHRQQSQLRRAGLLAPPETYRSDYTAVFPGVPELLLAPLEFEFSPDVRQPFQHYLGLCIREHRTDTELDPVFAEQWPRILANCEGNNQLIYCSFGTFYTGSDTALLQFMTRLLEAIAAIPNVQVICSVNRLVIETLRARQTVPPNVHLFARVPQLAVLRHAALHLTHGGLSSVKESIWAAVPMLVYPLDLHYDQPGNGLKVEHHGLGLRGVFATDTPAMIHQKLTRLLTEPTFRQTIQHFRDQCTRLSAAEIALPLLLERLNTPAQ